METGLSVASTSPLGWKLPRISRSIGYCAGVLALSLCAFSAVGAVWGLLRPELTGHAAKDGGYVLDTVDNVEFTSFITFTLITGAMAMVLALVTYVRAPRLHSAAMIYWLGVVALAATAAFYVLGGVTATHVPADPGEVVHFVPTFSPGVAWVVAPFLAMFSYWSALFINKETEEVAPR